MIKNKTKNLFKWAIFSLFFCILIVGLGISYNAGAQFNVPVAPPPESNQYPFLLIDGSDQAKSGSLRFGTSDNSAPYSYQLEVLGEGALIENSVIENDLKVSETGNTLYVDSASNKVCVGPCLDVAGSKLEVGSQGMLVDSANYGIGVYAVSSDSEAIFGASLSPSQKYLASGTNHSLAIADDNTLWAWGLNNSGQIGDGTTTQRNSPVQALNLTDVVYIEGDSCLAVGGSSFAITMDGSIWAWGQNDAEQLGLGDNVDRDTPEVISDLPPIKKLLQVQLIH
ncbi:hypothetical protein KKF61_08560 [Patescibacteria group bacterium]|nr:hypothetical protein [Patescibacteria group bacterium]